MKITNAALIEQGETLLSMVRAGTVIPYVANGMSLSGMDCQGLIEYCGIQAGMPKAECCLAGSNAHWRASVWRGTPEDMVKAIGSIPAGVCPCIHAYDGGEVARGYYDRYGNCSHIGLYLGGKESIAASAGRKQVIESNFKGKTIPNGGWNALILLPWVDYGLSAVQLAALGIGDAQTAQPTEGSIDKPTIATDIDTADFYPVKKGCKGGAVERLQKWLVDLGYTLAVDHDFGPATEAAVIDFQSTHELVADGIVGKQTWAALSAARYDLCGRAKK